MKNSKFQAVPSRKLALFEGLIVSMIWASSFVLVKMVLPHLGPLTIAGLRYSIAFLILLPFVLRKRKQPVVLTPRLWGIFMIMGLSAYTIGNGAMFWGLKYLSATTTSFLLSITPVIVLFPSALWLKEVPSRWQTLGVLISIIGSALFFSPGIEKGQLIGFAIMGVGLIGFTTFGILTRSVARERKVDTLTLTTIPLGIGGCVLMLIALPMEGWPTAPAQAWGIVFWLAVVNTAVGYMLYNHALQVLTALEMNMLQNLSPFETVFIAWLLLGERLNGLQIAGMGIVIVGVMVVQQLRRSPERTGFPES
ncbi:MAG: EamA family transporter [Chloroflexota bacterium]